MLVKPVLDRQVLFDHFKKDVFLNLYNIADLKDPNWSHSDYYSISREGTIKSAVMIHKGLAVPIISAMTNDDAENMRVLLDGVQSELPARIYGNFTPGLIDVFNSTFHIQSFGEHYRMGLIDSSALLGIPNNIQAINASHRIETEDLINRNMHGHWFDPKMLESDYYFGFFADSKLVGVGGIHVFSDLYGVAALGNVTTDIHHRRKGIAQKVVSSVCHKLLKDVKHIGLNVKCDNIPAIKCYQGLGFEITHQYEEYMMTRIP